MLQSMRVKKAAGKVSRHSTQGTVEEAAKSAGRVAAKVKAAVAARDYASASEERIGRHPKELPDIDSAASAVDTSGGEDPGEQDWASMTVVALKDELRTRGLRVSGRKAELVERLSQA